MKRTRRVKIVATLGPATDSINMIKSLFDAGADVFRINMSHTEHEDMRELQQRIRKVEAEVDRPHRHFVRPARAQVAHRRYGKKRPRSKKAICSASILMKP